MKISKIISNITKTISNNKSEILLAIGLGGFVASTITAVAATPKALISLDELQNNEVPAEKIDYLKKVGIHYITPAILFTSSAICILSAFKIKNKKIQNIAMAYTSYHATSEKTISGFKDALINKVGQEEADNIEKEIKKGGNIIPSTTHVISTADTFIIKDGFTGICFNSTITNIERAVNEANRILLSEGCINLNDFYYEIGINQVGIGDEFGWKLEHYGGDLISITFDGCLTDDQKPAISLIYNNEPTRM